MNRCIANRLLLGYRDQRRLPAATLTRIEQHLPRCERCSSKLRKWRKAVEETEAFHGQLLQAWGPRQLPLDHKGRPDYSRILEGLGLSGPRPSDSHRAFFPPPHPYEATPPEGALVLSYLEASLPEGARRDFERHAKRCRRCRWLLATSRRILAELREVPDQPPDPDLEPEGRRARGRSGGSSAVALLDDDLVPPGFAAPAGSGYFVLLRSLRSVFALCLLLDPPFYQGTPKRHPREVH